MNEKSGVDFSKRELHTLSHHDLALCVCLIIQVLCTEGNTDDDGVGCLSTGRRKKAGCCETGLVSEAACAACATHDPPSLPKSKPPEPPTPVQHLFLCQCDWLSLLQMQIA